MRRDATGRHVMMMWVESACVLRYPLYADEVMSIMHHVLPLLRNKFGCYDVVTLLTTSSILPSSRSRSLAPERREPRVGLLVSVEPKRPSLYDSLSLPLSRVDSRPTAPSRYKDGTHNVCAQVVFRRISFTIPERERERCSHEEHDVVVVVVFTPPHRHTACRIYPQPNS